jgi:hypothetical protein
VVDVDPEPEPSPLALSLSKGQALRLPGFSTGSAASSSGSSPGA